MKKNIIIILSFLLLIFAGCKKLVTVDAPATSLNSENIYEKDVTAASVLTGIYTKISGTTIQTPSLGGICYYTGLSSDELSLLINSSDQIMRAYYANSLNSQLAGFEFWDNIYQELYVLNAALEGVNNSITLTAAVKKQLLGEAKFMRAFCFFYLVNLYGDVPLVLGTDYKTNTIMIRTSKDQVWQQIINDLKDAQELLSPDYLDASLLKVTNERVRPTKSAATALLARAYLYTKDWKQAEEQATAVIENAAYDLLPLDEIFLKNSKEAIWQLQPVRKGDNSQEAIGFIKQESVFGTSGGAVVLNSTLLNAFDNGDQRKEHWINVSTIAGTSYTYAYKYKKNNYPYDPAFPVDEYSVILRLAEQYLIKAEAKIQQGDIEGGIKELNILRGRATDKTAPQDQQLKQLDVDMSKESALLAVEHERQTELFTEWGHRWLDLKRTNRVDAIMTIEVPKKVSGAIWKSYQQLYPVRDQELRMGPHLDQTDGY